MSKCKYCGLKAGFLKNKHADCEKKYRSAKSDIIGLIENTIVETNDFENLKNDIETIADQNYVKSEEIFSLYTIGFDNAVEKFLCDGILTKEEEEKIEKFRSILQLPQDILDKNGAIQKTVKAAIIRELTEGENLESGMVIYEPLPFNFQKSEKLIWLFNEVEFFEQRTSTQYQGGYSGVSIRVAKGVYYRTGGFKGHPVKTDEMKFISTGVLALTTKHVYFTSSTKNFRIQIGKIITMNPYENGIGLQKDGATSKPQVFRNIDGWFVYNVISNLNV